MNKSLENVLKALEQDALAFCSESDWAIVVAECERAGNVRRVSKSAKVILEKAMSRSEAGKYAAQQRWKGHVKTTSESGGYTRNALGESRHIDISNQPTDATPESGVFKSPRQREQARKIMSDALRQTSIGADVIYGIMTGKADNATKQFARKLLGTRGFTPGQIREFVGRDTVETSGGETLETVRPPNPRYAAYAQYARENRQTPMSRAEHEAKYGGPIGPDSETSGDIGLGRVRSSAEPRGSGIKDDGTPFDGNFTTPQDTYGMVQTTRTGIKGVDLVNHPAYKGAKYAMELKAATLYQLQGEIVKMHRAARKKVPESAKPYMDALSFLSSVKDMYGMDSGKSIVAYTMSNIKFFGAQGRALKFELSARLKER